MNKKQKQRLQSLLPDGVPRYVRIYDNAGRSADRYTIIFSGNYRFRTGGEFMLISMSYNPYHPQGVCMTSTYPYQCDTLGKADANGKRQQNSCWAGPKMGRSCHLGKRIPFTHLPEDCQMAVLQSYMGLWDVGAEPDEHGRLSCATVASYMLENFGTQYAHWLPKDSYR